MHTEMETLVVERADSIAHDLVCQLENGLADEPIRFRQFAAGIVAGYPHGGFRIEVKDDAPLAIAREGDQTGHTFSPVGFLFHAEVAHLCGALQSLRQHGIRRIDEGLYQLHLHEIRLPRWRCWSPRRLHPSRT